MTELKLDQKIIDSYNAIRQGAGFENSLASSISSLKSRATNLKTTAQGYPPDPDLTTLITNLEDLETTLDDFLTHTNVITGVEQPGEDSASPFGFQSRISILQGSLNIVESGFDQTDTETEQDKIDKVFGSVISGSNQDLNDLDVSLTELENQSGSAVTLSTEATTQNPILANINSNLINTIDTENNSLDEEIQRLRDLGTATSLFSLSQDTKFNDILDNVLDSQLKTILGI